MDGTRAYRSRGNQGILERRRVRVEEVQILLDDTHNPPDGKGFESGFLINDDFQCIQDRGLKGFNCVEGALALVGRKTPKSLT